MNEKQKRYVELLAQCKIVAQAARDAGYSEHTANKVAWKWIGDTREGSKVPEMFDLYQKLSAKESAEFRKKYDMDKEFLKGVIKPILNSNIQDYVIFNGRTIKFKPFDQLTTDQLAAIESIKKGRNGIELKLHGKSWGLDAIAKHIGFFEEDNKQKDNGAAKVLIEIPDNGRGQVVPYKPDES